MRAPEVRKGGGVGLGEARPGISGHTGAQNREIGDWEPCRHASTWVQDLIPIELNRQGRSLASGKYVGQGVWVSESLGEGRVRVREVCGSGSLGLREFG